MGFTRSSDKSLGEVGPADGEGGSFIMVVIVVLMAVVVIFVMVVAGGKNERVMR